MSAAVNALKSHAKISLGKTASKELLFYCNHMADRSTRFVEEMLKYMDSMYRELHEAFGNNSAGDMWELVCFCVLEISVTEFRPARELADGVSTTRMSESGPYFLHASVQIMKSTESFLKVGICNHPS